jgi:hypothetical protein
METEIQDFVRFCAVERRLAPLTCSAYELALQLLDVVEVSRATFFSLAIIFLLLAALGTI